MPTISVIVPVYKVEPYLRRCVDSVLNQTFSDFELILVDDGSPDNCGAICDEYATKDNRVIVIHQENGGLSAARNAGIDWVFANSNSQWLSFVDSDDWIHAQMLEALLLATSQANLPVGITSFKKVYCDEDADLFDWDPQNIEICDTEDFFCKRNVEATIACAKLYHKELFRNLRYPIDKIHEDEFLTYQVIFQTKEIVYIADPMYLYFQNAFGITHAKWSTKKLDKVQAFREQMDWFKENNYDRAYRTRLTSYIWVISENIRILSESDDSHKKKHIRQLKRTLRAFLREKKVFFSPNKTETRWVFQITYPTEMKVYRFFQRKKQALQTLGIKGIIRRLAKK